MISSNDVRRLFLQAVLSRGVLSYNLALALWERSVSAVKAANEALEIPFAPQRGNWDRFVTEINNSLDTLDVEFRSLHDETTGQEMYALVNRRGDDNAQIATSYNATEIAYFKAIIEQIMLAPQEAYSVSSLAALREVNTLKPTMTKAQAELVLGSFVAKGWLLKSKRGRYSLSTRTLLELSPYIKSTYPEECLECLICMEIITRGAACKTANCQTRMHYHCFRNYRRRSETCPACQKAWPHDASGLRAVGEDAVKDGQDERRRVRRKSTADESDHEEEVVMEDDEEAAGPSQPVQTQKRAGRSKGTKGDQKKKAAHNADIDGEDEDDIDALYENDEEEAAPPARSQRNSTRRSGRAR